DPELVEKFIRATAKGVQWSCNNQDEAAQAMVGEVPEMNIAAATAGVEAACSILWVPEAEENGLGYMSEEGVQNVLDVTKEYLGLQGDVEASDVYTNDFNPGIM